MARQGSVSIYEVQVTYKCPIDGQTYTVGPWNTANDLRFELNAAIDYGCCDEHGGESAVLDGSITCPCGVTHDFS